MRSHLLALAALISALGASPVLGARAGEPAPVNGRSAEARPEHDLVASLPPYPPPASDEGKADLAILLWEQRTRWPEDVARARSEVDVGLDTFAAALGRRFDPRAHPRTRALLDTLRERAGLTIGAAKERFARPRPFNADARVQPVVPRPRSYAYPSGHATIGVLMARGLAELAPSCRTALVATGRRVGYDRVVGGVHYPSDVIAGQQLGERLADVLLADPGLHRDIEAVRAAEWRPEACARP